MKRKKGIWILWSCLLLCLLTACGRKNPYEEKSEQFYIDALNNLGESECVTYDEKTIYYHIMGAIWAIDKDGSNQRKLCDQKTALGLWYQDGLLYYTEKDILWTLDIATLEKKRILEKSIYDYFIIRDKLYFTSDEPYLYVCDLKTMQYEIFVQALNAITEGTYIYYKDRENNLYRTDPERKQSIKMAENVSYWMRIRGGYLYFTSRARDDCDYRICLDDITEIEECERQIGTRVEYQGYLYHIKKNCIVVTNMATGESTQYEELRIYGTCSAENYLIYQAWDRENDKVYYKMLNMDTGEFRILHEKSINDIP